MPNRAYLVGSQNPATAGLGDRGINYDPDTEILAGASVQVPIFWLSLFDVSQVKPHLVQEYRIPSAVCPAAAGRKLLAERGAKTLATFSNCSAEWEAWVRLINEAPFEFFKLDATEIWDLDPELFEARLLPAVRWFASGTDEDFVQLLGIAEISFVKRGLLSRFMGDSPSGYDRQRKTLTITRNSIGREDSTGHHLHGYSWVREVTWDD